jgi:PAS domain S-box-containing protein
VRDVSGGDPLEPPLDRPPHEPGSADAPILAAVAECARTFLEPGSWADRVPAALALLGEAAEASRVLLFELQTQPDGSGGINLRAHWSAAGVESRLGTRYTALSLDSPGFQGWAAALREGRFVANTLGEVPDAHRERLQDLGVRSLALVPIRAGGEWWGGLSFHDCARERRWPEGVLRALQAAAACLGAAIERERAESALRESEERFQRLAAAPFEGIALTDGGVFLDANAQLAAMLGTSLAELVGRRVIDFVVPEDRAMVLERSAAQDEGPYTHTVLRPDGSRLPVEVRAKPVPYRGKTVRLSALLDIRERVRSEEALRASAKKYRDMFESSPVGIYQSLPDGTLITVNLALARLLGYDAVDEIVGRNLVRDVYWDPNERAGLIATHEQGGRGEGVEVCFKRRDGTPVWIEMAAHAVKDPEGRTLYFECFVLDIDGRKAAEAELRESEARYRLLFEENPAPMVIYDQATLACLDANQAVLSLYGYSREEMLGTALDRLVVPEERDRARAAQRADRPDRDQVGIRRTLRRDGTVLEVEITNFAVTFAGRPARLVVGHDVTVQRRLHAEVERAADEWRRTFDAADAGLLILDEADRVTRLNRSARELAGGDEIAGRTLADLGPGEPWISAGVAVQAARRSSTSETASARDPVRGLVWDLTASLIPEPEGEGRAIVVVRDVTRLAQLQESLKRTEVLSVMGGLVAGVAHEVRNPLFSISASLDELEAEFGADSRYLRYAGLLRAQIVRLSHLMNALLEYGKSPQLQLAEARPADLIRRAARACSAAARERSVQVEEEVAPGVPAIPLDAARMEQVLENLIANAIQHSPPQTRVRVCARVEDADPAAVVFAVEDSGPGLTEADLPRLFDPFFSRRKGGTGLGLSIVQSIVDAHGGSVTGANRPQGGAVFTVRLTARARAAAS